MKNSDRILVKILKEVCEERRISCVPFATDWIISLEKGGVRRFVYGYLFPNNNACSAALCGDKSGLYSALTDAGISAVPHYFFMPPKNIHYVGKDDTNERLVALAACTQSFAVKPNEGTGGECVTRVNGIEGLTRAVKLLFKRGRSVAVSPFIDIEDEFRIVVFEGEAELIFKKERPFVTGDGAATVARLAARKYGEAFVIKKEDVLADVASVPNEGGTVLLNWKHNLGSGARAVEIIKDKSGSPPQSDTVIADAGLFDELASFAVAGARAAGISFASVDVIRADGKLSVMEINAGVMLENFAAVSVSNYQKAKSIYAKAVVRLF
ncbi:MAG: hypothetical protein LBT55_03625 [Clostridiaceae bacterium]|jgi:glutathione synthase/RimK-type ligase-like ATP-grasp enzyme|nr:hypothetical protein [Clostridiaceae bacterium]